MFGVSGGKCQVVLCPSLHDDGGGDDDDGIRLVVLCPPVSCVHLYSVSSPPVHGISEEFPPFEGKSLVVPQPEVENYMTTRLLTLQYLFLCVFYLYLCIFICICVFEYRVRSSWWRITWQPVSQLSSRPIALLRHGESAKFNPFLQN